MLGRTESADYADYADSKEIIGAGTIIQHLYVSSYTVLYASPFLNLCNLCNLRNLRIVTFLLLARDDDSFGR